MAGSITDVLNKLYFPAGSDADPPALTRLAGFGT